MNTAVGAGADEVLEWAGVCVCSVWLEAPGLVGLQPFCPHLSDLDPAEHGGKGRYQYATLEETREVLVSLAIAPLFLTRAWGFWAKF